MSAVDSSSSGPAPAADRLVDALEEMGVELVFGLPGVHNLAIWRALSGSRIRLIGVRHEQTAVYAADGYARATGRLGVAIVTTGPGAANTLGATGEAMASGSPVLVIATDIPTRLRRPGVYRGVLHETRDQGAMFGPVTKGQVTVQAADELVPALDDAARLALAAPSGPVYLGVPTDLLTESVGPASPTDHPAALTAPALGPELAQAARVLADAEHPLIWAGGGAARSGAGDAIGALATRLGAPVLTTYMGRGVISPEHPYAAPNPVHLDLVGALWDEADAVLAVGTDFDGMMTQNWAMPAPPALVAVNVDAEDASKNYPATVTLTGDARTVLEALVEAVPERTDSGEVVSRLSDLRQEVDQAVLADEPQAHEFLHTFESAVPPDAVVVADMCIPGYWLGGFHRVPAPGKLAYPVGWGTLGFGFPASIGSALAGQGPAVCVTGDGGFLFACGELATLLQEQVPLTIVLVDDGGYGMLRFDQVHAGDQPYGVDLARPDFTALAAAFGIPATSLGTFGAPFGEALRAGIASGGPNMIVVKARLRPPPNTSPRWYRRRPPVPAQS